MSWNIVYTMQARKDLRDIYEHIAFELLVPETASGQTRRIMHMIRSLEPKERRYVSTNWIKPFDNDNASPVAVDIYRPCYPRICVPAYEIELQLFKGENGNR